VKVVSSVKVLMATGHYVLSGASTVIENLASGLSKKDVDVTIGALMFKRIPSGPYEVSRIPIGNMSRLRRFLEKFDIVHSHHPIMNYLDLVSSRPFLYHYHGAPNFGKENVFRFSMLLSVGMTNHRFDAIIAVSEAACTELKRYFNLKNMYVVYNGVDTSLFRPGLEQRFRKGTPQYLFVGNLYEYKRVEEIVLAFKELVETHPRAHLQIVGGGCTHARLQDIIAKLNLQEHVSLTGPVAYNELPYYYSSCDGYVTASRCETFSLPLVEAWACGKPVVASRIPCHAELIAKSNAGWLYKVGDTKDLCAKMTLVHEHDEEYKNRAVRFAKQYDWAIVTDEILRLYEFVAKNGAIVG
jgi:glycosyltransferase involved in cell wall biosynthesis